MISSALLVASSLALTANVGGGELVGSDDWPGWRGPGGNAVATGTPPLEWSEEKNVRWKTEIPGKGNSSAVVVGDIVFVTTAVGTGKKAPTPEPVAEGEGAGEGAGRGAGGGDGAGAGDGGRGGRGGFGRGGPGGGRGGFGGRATPPDEHHFFVYALDRKDGSILWEQNPRTGFPPQGMHSDSSFATPTPVSDGEHVIASFGSNGIYAYTMDGKLVWETDLGDMEIMNAFGEGSSPVLHGDTVVVIWDHNGDSFIVALDKATGEERWRQERESATSWTTPLIVEHEGRVQVIVGTSRTVAYDLETGEELWWYGTGGGRGGVISSPVIHNGVFVASTGNRGGEVRAIELESAKGEITSGEGGALLWTASGDNPYVSSPIAYDGIVYMLKSNSGVISAFDALSGERVYGPERMDALANAYASPVAAAGRLYFPDRDGLVEVISAGPELKVLAVNKIDEGIDASLAIAGDEIFLRGATHLYCIAEE